MTRRASGHGVDDSGFKRELLRYKIKVYHNFAKMSSTPYLKHGNFAGYRKLLPFMRDSTKMPLTGHFVIQAV